jgi:hypothetical protein
MVNEISNKLQKIIDEYNAAEAKQTERLKEIFDLIDARKGYRRVDFGGVEVWSNCWDRENKEAVYTNSIYNIARPITEVITGND